MLTFQAHLLYSLLPKNTDLSAQGGFSVDAPPHLTKYLNATEHEEWQVIDAMHLSTQSFDF